MNFHLCFLLFLQVCIPPAVQVQQKQVWDDAVIQRLIEIDPLVSDDMGFLGKKGFWWWEVQCRKITQRTIYDNICIFVQTGVNSYVRL